jgi:hypothetical protein
MELFLLFSNSTTTFRPYFRHLIERELECAIKAEIQRSAVARKIMVAFKCPAAITGLQGG